MAHIQPVHEAIQNPHAKAARTGQLASTVLLAISGIAMAALYALDPQGFLLQANHPALAIIGSVGATALASFVLITVLRCCANRKNGERSIAPDVNDPLNACVSNSGVHPTGSIAIESAAPIVLNDPLALELVALINSTIDEVENLILAFNAAYYSAFNEKLANEAEIRAGMQTMKSLVIGQATKKLHNKQMLVADGLNMLLSDMIDGPRFNGNLNMSPQNFITSLPQILKNSSHPPVQECIEGIFTQIAKSEDLDKDQAFTDLLQAIQKAFNDALAKQNAKPKEKRTEKEQQEINALVNIYLEKRKALFAYLLQTTLTPEQVEAFAPLVLEATIKGFFADFNTKFLVPLLGGFDKEGLFNATKTKAGVIALKAAPETIFDVLDKFELLKMDNLPINPADKEPFIKAAKQLSTSLANPIFYLISPLWGYGKFQKGVQALLEDKDKKLTPPNLDVSKTAWREYVTAYTAYLKTFTAELGALKF